jgi:ABC-type nitrate/sulfonate/bicarbonate transport system permease component
MGGSGKVVAAFGSSTLRRALTSLAVLAFVYVAASEIGSRTLPRRIWMGAHYVEDVDLVPRVSSLADEASFLVEAGLLQQSVVASGQRVLGGVLLGALVGVPLGLACGWARRLDSFVSPWLVLFRFTPALALLPLYVLWFGSGELPKILLISTTVATVTLQGAFDGVRAVPRIYIDAATSLGAKSATLLRKIVVPAALPHILTGVRIATALAWVTMVVAELIRPEMPSLGYLLALANAYPRVPTIMIGIATIGVLVLVSDTLVVALYFRATVWMRRRTA